MIKMSIKKILSIAMILFSMSFATQASIVWDESINGDFSNNGLSPTSVSFSMGSNVIIGSTGNPGTGIDRDYFSFVVPTDSSLSSITVLSNTIVSGSTSFIGLQAGPQLTVSTSGAGIENFLGFSHYGNDSVDTDILPSLVFSNFTGSLPSGTYSIWIQETGGVVPYGFDFAVIPTAVPIPGAGVLLFSALCGFRVLRKRQES